MKKSTLLLLLCSMLYLPSFCQSNTAACKEFRISSGIGIASTAKNLRSAGVNLWIQFDYKLAQHFSIAMESDFLNYNQNGTYANLPFKPNEIKVHDNDFSLLVKYHFTSFKKIKVELASGWTYCIKQTEYYDFLLDGTQGFWNPDISSLSEYTIPFLAEVAYPIAHNWDITARVKYNRDSYYGATYSAGAGLSLKL